MHISIRCLAFAAVLSLMACGTDIVDPVTLPEDIDSTPQQGQLGFVNAIPNSPILVVDWESATTPGSIFADEGVAELPFAEGGSFSIGEDTYTVRFGYPTLAGEPIIMREFSEENGDSIQIKNDTQVTIIASGLLENPTFTVIEEIEYQNGVMIPTDGSGLITDPEIQFAHVAHGVDPLDFYMTASDVELDSVNPDATLGPSEVSALIIFEPAEYRIRVTPAGEKTPVLYDSGVFGLASNGRALLPLFNYFGPGEGVVRARFIAANALNFAFDSNPAAVRIINVVEDVPEIDVYLGEIDGDPNFAGLAFAEFPEHQEIDGGSFFFNVTPAGATIPLLFEGTLSVPRGESTTLVVAGLLEDPVFDNNRNIRTTVVADENRAIATAVQIRAYHVAPFGQVLNVYLVQPGQPIDDQPAFLASVQVGTSGISFRDAGDYDLVIERATDNTILYGPEPVSVAPDSLYTVVIRDPVDGGTNLAVDFQRRQVL